LRNELWIAAVEGAEDLAALSYEKKSFVLFFAISF
jgi:hypothetical protein